MIVGAGPLPYEDAAEFLAPLGLIPLIKERIAQPSARTKQIAIGPSKLGDPCDYCVASQMAAKLPGSIGPRPQRFALAPWYGTAVHAVLADLFDGLSGWTTELKLDIGEIEGYGSVSGSTDAYNEDAETVVDWKIVGDNTINKLRREGLAPVYEYQRQLYGLGIELSGRPIKYVMNVYFPRNGSSIDDLKFEVNHYDRSLAEEALARAKVIWDTLCVPGLVHTAWRDPDCYDCNGPRSFNTGGLIRRGNQG